MAFVVTDSSVTEQQEFRALEYVCFVCVLGHNMDIWFLEGGQLRIAGDHNKRVLRSLIETKPASLFRAILMIAIVVVRIIGSVTDQHTLFEMYQVCMCARALACSLESDQNGTCQSLPLHRVVT
jgi:hypothetical protein